MITISRENLHSALSAVTRAVERRNTNPILSNCLIETTKTGIRLTATDLDIQIEIETAAECEGAVSTTLPAVTLSDITKSLPGGADLKIAPAGHGAHMAVSSGRSRFKLLALPSTDFPKLSDEDFTATFTLPAKVFSAAIEAVSFAISTEETRFYLNGIFTHAGDDGELILVATDGHRLAKRQIADVDAAKLKDCGKEGMPGVIVPRKACGIIPKLFSDGEIKVSVSSSKIRIATPGLVFTSKLIDGTFPDYKRVIPSAEGSEAIIDAKTLRDALGRVATVASGKGRATRFAFSKGNLTLSVANPDAGDAEDTITYEGEIETATGFNAGYVAEAVGSLDAETISLIQSDAGSPAVLTPVPRVPGALAVVMPMRV